MRWDPLGPQFLLDVHFSFISFRVLITIRNDSIHGMRDSFNKCVIALLLLTRKGDRSDEIHRQTENFQFLVFSICFYFHNFHNSEQRLCMSSNNLIFVKTFLHTKCQLTEMICSVVWLRSVFSTDDGHSKRQQNNNNKDNHAWAATEQVKDIFHLYGALMWPFEWCSRAQERWKMENKTMKFKTIGENA